MAHDFAKELIAKRKKLILNNWNKNKTEEENINEWDYNKRSKTHPKECPCYKDKPCHNKGDINCLLCFCPEYDLSKEEGGCLRKGNGKYIQHPTLAAGKIWDCSGCDWPHKKDNIKKYIKEILR